MNFLIKIIIIALVLLAVITIFQKGLDGFKSNPLQSMMDTGKSIVGFSQDKLSGITNPTSNINNLGKPSCLTNDNCNKAFAECNNKCTCLGDGTCTK